ncbi:hypothetical protein PIB30_042548 [Stylosanthes scabra]|uniref:CCHC-type domain-containing protein n=1 Tax=Stylosanthes scabra TaxID=79078 RepID=A0ABU6WI13_9FABA|nr:hypothetical protein [Stylosanthes scabra]
MRFEAGLRDEIQLQLSLLENRSFTQLMETCECTDDCCEGMAILRNANSNCHCETLVATLLHECQRCGKPHGTRPYRTDGSNCHNCGKSGHLTRSFRARKSGPGQPTRRQQPAGRVSALTRDGSPCQDDTPWFPRGHKDNPDTCRDAVVYGIDGPGQQKQQSLRYKGYHGTAPCRANGTSCFSCGQPWHFARDCRVAFPQGPPTNNKGRVVNLQDFRIEDVAGDISDSALFGDGLTVLAAFRTSRGY